MNDRINGPRRAGPLALNVWIAALVLVCILPGLLLAAYASYRAYKWEYSSIAQRAVESARSLTRVVERDLVSNQAALEVLATSNHLDNRDFAAFYRQAVEVLHFTSGFTIVLTDASGQQAINLLRPYGSPLPRHGSPDILRRVLESRKPVVSDIYTGGVTGKPLVAIEVPVIRNEKALYGLALGIDPRHLGDILKQQGLPSEWVISIFDSTGTIVARDRAAEQYVGHKGSAQLLSRMSVSAEGMVEAPTLEGIPVMAAFSRSPVYGWTVAIGIPEAILTADLRRGLLIYALGACALLLLGLWLARIVSLRISRPIQRLISPALAIGKGEEVALPPLDLKEADEVGRALLNARDLLHQRDQTRMHAEQSLRMSEERLAAIIRTAMDAIITVDENQRVVLFNAAAERLFRCTAPEVIGTALERFLPERVRAIHRSHVQAFGATGVNSRSMHAGATIYGLRSDGEEFPCEATISQAIAGGRKLYTVILRDLSERRKAEQLQQLTTRLLDVRDHERKRVANELHENVTQYLAAVGMYLSSARNMDAAASADARRFLDEGHALLGKCSSILRSIAGDLYPEELDMFGLVAAIRSHVTDVGERHGIEVSLDVPADLERLPAEYELG